MDFYQTTLELGDNRLVFLEAVASHLTVATKNRHKTPRQKLVDHDAHQTRRRGLRRERTE